MKNMIILLVFLGLGCNQISGVDEIHFSKDSESNTDETDDAGVDTSEEAAFAISSLIASET